MTYTTEVTPDDEDAYQALMIPVSELLDAIACYPRTCPDCGIEAVLQIPCKNPTRWDLWASHSNTCSNQGLRPEMYVVK